MKKIAYMLCGLAVITTLGIGMDTMSKPYTLTTIGFILWAISPYGLLLFVINKTKSKAAIIGGLVLSVLAVLFGLVFIIDAMYIHLDAQGGLIYIFAPLWQWVGLLVLSLPVLSLNMVKNR